jgi:hypothetical protein
VVIVSYDVQPTIESTQANWSVVGSLLPEHVLQRREEVEVEEVSYSVQSGMELKHFSLSSVFEKFGLQVSHRECMEGVEENENVWQFEIVATQCPGLALLYRIYWEEQVVHNLEVLTIKSVSNVSQLEVVTTQLKFKGFR